MVSCTPSRSLTRSIWWPRYAVTTEEAWNDQTKEEKAEVEAIEVLYTSETFNRLQDDATGLYYQSPGYVYSFLQNELKIAKVI